MSDESKGVVPGAPVSSVRETQKPIISRKVWILNADPERQAVAVEAISQAGHEIRTAATSNELAMNLREFRPDIIIIDMQQEPDRGRHTASQLRADRATRQLPIFLVGLSKPDEIERSDKSITGPTRRYAGILSSPTVLNSILAEL